MYRRTSIGNYYTGTAMSKRVSLLVVTALLSGLFAGSAYAFDDFTGIVEKRPGDEPGALGKYGQWIIGGRPVHVTVKTTLDNREGEIEEGACVEVDISQGWVIQIEREDDWRCRD